MNARTLLVAGLAALSLTHVARANPSYIEILNDQLHQAVLEGDQKNIVSLCDRGARVDSTKKGKTPLMRAALGGDEEAAELLIKRGAKVNITDYKGKTALFWAACKSHAKICRLLVDNGAQTPNDKDLEEICLAVIISKVDACYVKRLFEGAAG